MIFSNINKKGKRYFAFALTATALLFMGSCSNNSKDNSEESAAESEMKVADQGEKISHESASYIIKDGNMVSVSGRPMVVDFYADWCPPCRRMKPIFDSLAEKYKEEIDFVSVNVDSNQELAAKYGVQNIPTFLFVASDGKVVDKIIGAVSQSDFSTALANYFPEQAGE